ncbi:MAG: hypothetical protein JWL88_80, partial [Parcubacteria group bacterium]|nr:hypothetical protein [Parcubacteria group bacterium]
MKKYSTDYFEKKYKILAERLIQKDGFKVAIQAARKELGLPEKGFASTQELAYFLIGKMTKPEQRALTFVAFVEAYAHKNKISVTDENREEIEEAFFKEYKKDGGVGMIPMMFELAQNIETHHSLFTKHPFFEISKNLSKLFPAVKKLMQSFWGVDLLDDHVIIHYIEKYLFLGQAGIDQYIKSKLSCHNCKYLGIDHFSPSRADMQGQDKGPYSKGYIFNKEAVQRLSAHFNSVFLIIKPYATKEMVHQYIEDNWDDLKEHIVEKNTFYKQFDVNPTLIKESDDERNKLVYELNKLPKKELLEMYKGAEDFSPTGIYKETIVSAILAEEYDIQMTSDAVKKTASRYSSSTKVHNV